MQESTCSGKAVLAYLQDMVALTRGLHRPDLAEQYQAAWEEAALAIYGPLPPRKPATGHYVVPEPTPAPPPLWKRRMLAKPFRKIIRRFPAMEDGITIDYEQLECGHTVIAGIDLPGTQAQRRRCAECAQLSEAKKPVASANGARTRRAGGSNAKGVVA